jgi:NAD(P)-dependent dehydrogenase (short-subunit alcohol dehydrogenase family)
MGKTFVVSGGNSGIGLEAARQLAAQGHHVVLLGRDPEKGRAAVARVVTAGGTAEFIAADLSVHAGTRACAEGLLARFPRIDGLILGAGVLTVKDVRTADGLHPVFAVNYLHRYHLTQRLLPALKAAGNASVVLLVAGVPLSSRVDFAVFPRYQPFPGMRALASIQIANFHYVQHLETAEPTLRAAVTNVGLVQTEIMREMPAPLRLAFRLSGPLFTVPVETAARNAVYLSTSGGWSSGRYWARPGDSRTSVPLALDAAVTAKVVAASRELTFG